jgi:hypothetical protein
LSLTSPWRNENYFDRRYKHCSSYSYGRGLVDYPRPRNVNERKGEFFECQKEHVVVLHDDSVSTVASCGVPGTFRRCGTVIPSQDVHGDSTTIVVVTHPRTSWDGTKVGDPCGTDQWTGSVAQKVRAGTFGHYHDDNTHRTRHGRYPHGTTSLPLPESLHESTKSKPRSERFDVFANVLSR